MSKMNKSRKLFATTATAALVASAIVPVASAAAYTDADKIAPWAKEAVEFLSAQEVIGGNPDGSFNPQGNIIRAEAAKMFATALELSEEGTENFSDVSAKDWFYGSVVAVSNAGIVAGKGAGVFAPKANLTRAEAAKMIVGAYGLKGEADLSKFADAKNVSGKWSEEFLSTAVANGVINGKDGKLAANDSITRQEFAVMFKRAIEASEKVEVDFAAELTEALTALDKATKALDAEVKIETIEASKAAVATAKTAITTAQTALDAAVKAEAITVAVTTKATADIEFSKEAVKKAEAKIAEVEEAAKAPKVQSVTAINAKQVEVKFNKEVGTGAETTTNYDVKAVVGGSPNAVVAAELQADGKTVILTLTDAYKVATDIVVSVDGIYLKGSIKEQFPKFATVINVNDIVAPKITSVLSQTNTNSAQNVTVQFSEPLKAVPVTKVNGTVVVGTLSNNDTTLTLTGLNLSADKVHELEVLNFEDFAENKVTYVKQNFSVTKDATIAQGKAVMVSDNKVEVAFDKAINNNSLKNVDILRYDETTKSYVPVTLVSGKEFILDKTGKVATFNIDASEGAKFFGLNDNTETLIVKVKSGVLDTSGNQVKTFEQSLTASKDVTGPAFESVTFKKDSKGAVTELFFQFNEGLTFEGTGTKKLVASDIKVTDLSTNNEVLFTDVFGSSNTVEVAADGKTLIVKPEATVANKLKSGKYSFEVKKGLVKDTSFGTNESKLAAKTVDFGVVANEVTVEKAEINLGVAVDNKLTVDFSQAVTASSAINPANYLINGEALPTDTVIKVASATKVEFTLPANTVAKSDGAAVLTVTNVKAQDSSATFKTFVGTINALDNTAPVAKATVLKNGLVQLTFSEAVTIDENDFKQLKINGKELKGASTATSGKLADDTEVVLVSVAAVTATDYNSTGFTYQYIDVDGDNKLDLTKDIVLKSVKSATAPTDWTAVADLNLTNTVEIIVSAIPATTDKSTLNNAQTNGTVGNKLQTGVIKAK